MYVGFSIVISDTWASATGRTESIPFAATERPESRRGRRSKTPSSSAERSLRRASEGYPALAPLLSGESPLSP